MMFTAIKRMSGKFLLSQTMFNNCLLGNNNSAFNYLFFENYLILITQNISLSGIFQETHQDPKTGKLLTEKGFLNTLGIVLGNSKDWNGDRKNRRAASAIE